LLKAVLVGKLDVVDSLINAGVDLETKVKYTGETALMVAASHGKLAMVGMLTAAGADLEAKSNHGNTALMNAASAGKLQVVEALAKAGANLAAKNKDANTASMLANKNSKHTVVKFLNQVEAEAKLAQTAKLKAARVAEQLDRQRRRDMLGQVLRSYYTEHAPSKVDKVDGIVSKYWNNQAKLFAALEETYGAAVIQYVDTTAKGGEGEDEQKKVNDADGASLTAMFVGKLDEVQMQVKAGVDLETKTKNGHTALLLAALVGELDVVQTLAEAGADPDAKGRDGMTALQHAALTGNLDMVNALIEAGADLSTKDGDGRTALELAKLLGRRDVTAALQRAQTDATVALNSARRVATQAAFDAVVRAFYTEHAPEQVGKVDGIVSKYWNNQAKLFAALEDKYQAAVVRSL
jgi:ankyrin repeat protein